jgi:DNA-binding response OmpR family regulator
MAKFEKIVVIEDDEFLLEHMCVVLNLHDYEVVGFASKPKDEDLLKAKPELNIIDIFLPNGNGLEIAQEIRAKNPRQKIILTSADQHTLHFLGEALADAVLPKPFTGLQLMQVVQQLET